MKFSKIKKDVMFASMIIKCIIQRHVPANVKQSINVLQTTILTTKHVNANVLKRIVLKDLFKILFAIALNNTVLHLLFLAKMVQIGIHINVNVFHNLSAYLPLRVVLQGKNLTLKPAHANALNLHVNALCPMNGIQRHVLASASTVN